MYIYIYTHSYVKPIGDIDGVSIKLGYPKPLGRCINVMTIFWDDFGVIHFKALPRSIN